MKESANDDLSVTKNLKDDGDDTDHDLRFEKTFALVAFAIVQVSHGEQLAALFHHPDDQPEGTYELTYYDPVHHTPSSTLVGFEGLLPMEGGPEIEEFRDRWCVVTSVH